MASKQNLDAGSLMPLQRPQPPLRRKYSYMSHLVKKNTGCTTPNEEANISSDLAMKKKPNTNDRQRTRPLGPHDKTRPSPPNNVPHEIGPRNYFWGTGGNMRLYHPFQSAFNKRRRRGHLHLQVYAVKV